MTVDKLQDAGIKIQAGEKKTDVKLVIDPVVNEKKSEGWKDLWGTFSRFVLVGGDLV